jgi:hypothetical protein
MTQMRSRGGYGLIKRTVGKGGSYRVVSRVSSDIFSTAA